MDNKIKIYLEDWKRRVLEQTEGFSAMEADIKAIAEEINAKGLAKGWDAESILSAIESALEDYCVQQDADLGTARKIFYDLAKRGEIDGLEIVDSDADATIDDYLTPQDKARLESAIRAKVKALREQEEKEWKSPLPDWAQEALVAIVDNVAADNGGELDTETYGKIASNMREWNQRLGVNGFAERYLVDFIDAYIRAQYDTEEQEEPQDADAVDAEITAMESYFRKVAFRRASILCE